MEIDELYIYYKFLFGYVYSLCKNKELSEDIVQDTFVKAMQNIHKFKGECKVETWLCGIAKNLYVSHIRKKDNQNVPEPYKEVFSLHVFGEISLVDIGALFGKSNSWASVTFYRAKKKIIEIMKENGYEEDFV